MSPRIIFFDGYCVACNKVVDFILARDSSESFTFAALQTENAEVTLPSFSYPLKLVRDVDSVVYLRDGKVKTKSEAVLSILVDLGGIYKATVVLYAVPKPIRNRLYDGLVQRRYRWFGKKENCRVITPAERARFLE